MTDRRVFTVAGLALLSVFLLSLGWEFLVEDLFWPLVVDDYHAESLPQRWEYVLSSTCFAGLALMLPTLMLRRAIADRDQSQKALLESEGRLNAFFTSSPAGLAIFDTELRYRKINETLAKINGPPVGDHLGRTIRDVIPGLAQTLEPMFRTILETGKPVLNWELAEQSPSDPEVRSTWQSSLFPIFGAGDKAIGIGAIVVDISERKQAEDALRDAYDAVEERVRARTAELEESNTALKDEIADRERVEEELSRAQSHLSDAIESMSEGFALFDADDRLVLHNGNYRDFWPNIADLLIVGTPFEEIARASGESGLMVDAVGRVDDWLSRRLEQHRAAEGSHEQQLTDGRWMLAIDRRTSDGGIVCIRMDITESKRREQALRENQARLQAILDHAPVNIALKDLDGRHIVIGAQCLEIFGISAEEALGKTSHELFPKDLADSFVAQDRLVLESGEAIERENQIALEDGIHTVLITKFPIPDGTRGTSAICAISTDITERRQAELQLRQSEERFKAIVDNSPNLIYLKDTDGRYLLFNKTFENEIGWSSGDARGKTAYDLVSKDLADLFSDHDQEVIRIGDVVVREESVPYANGQIRSQIATKFPIFDENGNIMAVGGVNTDITERKQAEHTLRLQEQRLRGIMENVADGVATIDEEGRIESFNPAAERMFGYAANEVVGDNAAVLMSEADGVHHQQYVRAYIHTGEGRIIGAGPREVIARRRDGSTFPLEIAVSEMCLGEKRVFIGAMRDITDRKRIEQEARESGERFRAVVENAPMALVMKDPDGRYYLTNQRFREWFGDSATEMRGKTTVDFVPKDQADALIAQDKEVLEELTVVEREHELRFADGSSHRVMVTKFPVSGGANRGVHVGSISVDVSEQRRAEERLRQAQKMEAVGQLTGGVAHDFNNLLTVVIGNLELLEERCGDDKRLRPLALAAQDAALRGADLTHRLLSFSRKQSLRPEVIDLDELIPHMSHLLRRTLGPAVEIHAATTGDLWNTLADRGQLENALLNLAINARDAMPDGGSLTIEAANACLDQNDAAGHRDFMPGEFVVLKVSDTGVGMSVEVVKRAFDPFFTTKEIGGGSGLGLSMVYGFAKQSGGHVEIHSEPGRGTRIELYLPRAREGDAIATADPKTRRHYPTGNETVLVVEDDPDVRAFAVKLFAALGYDVLEASDGRKALEHLDGGAKVDLLFSDVMMPGEFSGRTLVGEARRRRPQLQALLTSGHPREAVGNGDGSGAAIELLLKPYTRAALARTVRKVLDEGMDAP